MPKATFTIDNVERIKEGQTGNKHWTLFRIHGSDGKKYSTFDSEWLLHVGTKVTAEFEKTPEGYLNLASFDEATGLPKKADEKPAASGGSVAGASTNGPEKFEILNGKLDAIMEILLTHFKQPEPKE